MFTKESIPALVDEIKFEMVASIGTDMALSGPECGEWIHFRCAARGHDARHSGNCHNDDCYSNERLSQRRGRGGSAKAKGIFGQRLTLEPP
jgi:hypothetical protein